MKQFCVPCHNNRLRTAGVTFEGLDLHDIGDNAALLERVLRKVRRGQMPPAGMPRPSVARTAGFSDWLEAALDAEAAAHPNPGRLGVHRLNRTEYSNAIRDILALDVNAGS